MLQLQGGLTGCVEGTQLTQFQKPICMEESNEFRHRALPIHYAMPEVGAGLVFRDINHTLPIGMRNGQRAGARCVA